MGDHADKTSTYRKMDVLVLVFDFQQQIQKSWHSLEAGLDTKYFIIVFCMDGIRQQHRTAAFIAIMPRKREVNVVKMDRMNLAAVF